MKKHLLFATLFTLLFGLSAHAAGQTDGEYMNWSYATGSDASSAASAPPQQRAGTQPYITSDIVPVPRAGSRVSDRFDALEAAYEASLRNDGSESQDMLAASAPVGGADPRLTVAARTPVVPQRPAQSIPAGAMMPTPAPVTIPYPIHIQPEITFQQPVTITPPAMQMPQPAYYPQQPMYAPMPMMQPQMMPPMMMPQYGYPMQQPMMMPGGY